jgi:UDP-galactopyranose mutase
MTTLGDDEWAGMDLSVRRGNDHDPSWFAGLNGLADEYDMIIVGAGISGCVFAERGSKELGLKSLIIDKRDHIGGNCYDFINKHGFRVSQYGVHLFHTKFDRVWEYVNEFSDWVPYEHRVKGKCKDVRDEYQIVPIPPSQETVNKLFDANVHSETEMEAWLDARRSVNPDPKNGEESALTRSGPELYEAIFKHYTHKQWDKWPEELDASVLARIPVRTNTDDRYFSDPHQALPKDGYTRIFENMIMSDPNITVRLNVDFFKERPNLPKCGLTVFTGPIDAYYASQGLPKLEYRSLRFFEEYHTPDASDKSDHPGFYQPCLQLNYPGPEVDFTRIVEYKHKPNQPAEAKASPGTVIFKEYSCDHGEPYYPVPNPANRELYERYQALATDEPGVCFVGRLASYKYFNMDQAFLNALEIWDEVKAGGKVAARTELGEPDGPK